MRPTHDPRLMPLTILSSPYELRFLCYPHAHLNHPALHLPTLLASAQQLARNLLHDLMLDALWDTRLFLAKDLMNDEEDFVQLVL